MAFLRRIWNKWQNLLHDEKLKHKIYVKLAHIRITFEEIVQSI